MNKKEFANLLKSENTKLEFEMSERLKNTQIVQKEEYLFEKRKTSLLPRFISLFACFVFCAFCFSLIFINKKPEESAEGITSYIMEINPSICITTDENDKIINVCALNYDADAIVLDANVVNIEGQSFDAGIERLMTVIRDKGYFDSHNEAIRIYAFNDNNECQYNRLNHFEELMKRKMTEFGYDIPFEKHRIGMDDFKEKIGYEEEYQTLNEMQDFFRQRGRSYIPPEVSV